MTAELASFPKVTGFLPVQYAICLKGIVWREGLRFLHQRERFLAALVRPLVWLFIFATGFRQVLGVSIIPPYETYILYEVYITPGLMLLIQLFNGMQSSLSMVYDREMGNMRTLLVSPMPRWFLLSSKLVAGMAVSLPQVYTFLAIAWFWEIEAPPLGYIAVLPALVLSGLMLGALGMLMSSVSKQLENFAGAMNFVIFPMFFASSALYPLWRVREASPLLYYVCELNPFTHAVELVRFALYCQINWISLAVVAGCTALFMVGAILAYNPSRGFLARRGDPEAAHEPLGRRYGRCRRTDLARNSARCRSTLSRLAVQSGQGAGDLRRRRVGRTGHRRRRERLGGRRRDKGFGRAARGAPHAARGRAEGDFKCHHQHRIRAAEKGETDICGIVQDSQSRAQRSDAGDRATFPQAKGIFRPNPIHDSPAPRAPGSV